MDTIVSRRIKQTHCSDCGKLTPHVRYDHNDDDHEEVCTICGHWRYWQNREEHYRRQQLLRLANRS